MQAYNCVKSIDVNHSLWGIHLSADGITACTDSCPCTAGKLAVRHAKGAGGETLGRLLENGRNH